MIDLRQSCEIRAIRCYELASAHFGRDFKRIPIEYSTRMTKTAGKFTYRGDEAVRIRFSDVLLDLNPEAFIERTVGHEVAHHIVFEVYGRGQPHGKCWQEVMKLFGQEPSRCHSYETPKTNKVKYVIEGKEYFLGKIQHGRCQRGQTYVAKGNVKITASDWVDFHANARAYFNGESFEDFSKMNNPKG